MNWHFAFGGGEIVSATSGGALLLFAAIIETVNQIQRRRSSSTSFKMSGFTIFFGALGAFFGIAMTLVFAHQHWTGLQASRQLSERGFHVYNVHVLSTGPIVELYGPDNCPVKLSLIHTTTWQVIGPDGSTITASQVACPVRS